MNPPDNFHAVDCLARKVPASLEGCACRLHFGGCQTFPTIARHDRARSLSRKKPSTFVGIAGLEINSKIGKRTLALIPNCNLNSKSLVRLFCHCQVLIAYSNIHFRRFVFPSLSYAENDGQHEDDHGKDEKKVLFLIFLFSFLSRLILTGIRIVFYGRTSYLLNVTKARVKNKKIKPNDRITSTNPASKISVRLK